MFYGLSSIASLLKSSDQKTDKIVLDFIVIENHFIELHDIW